jgi:SOS response regulatory protein OraA/RecX
VPEEVVVRTGLLPGMRLERPILRRLRWELKRSEALRVAGRALTRSDVSSRRLGQRLERAGVGGAVADSILETLHETGLVDDPRTARRRAGLLAERGYGDAAIAARLEAEGIDDSTAREAIAELPPERERAAKIPPKRLAARGFSAETIEEIVGPLD